MFSRLEKEEDDDDDDGEEKEEEEEDSVQFRMFAACVLITSF